jgi:hypothetical protein
MVFWKMKFLLSIVEWIVVVVNVYSAECCSAECYFDEMWFF